ncbi:hypothetical protein NPIL_55731 [Nephila pilipes]|uniref:Uncharacterized protein n=1 Tax=Nephila pilipes TaxID=299642 RepID=A0A8X6QRR8_NEPPI|nr:hypothetical protein NPIL_55731 [Nephila pilipes]
METTPLLTQTQKARHLDVCVASSYRTSTSFYTVGPRSRVSGVSGQQQQHHGEEETPQHGPAHAMSLHPSPFSRRYSSEDYPPPCWNKTPHLSTPSLCCNNSERESLVSGLVRYLPSTRDVPVGEFVLYPCASIDYLTWREFFFLFLPSRHCD